MRAFNRIFIFLAASLAGGGVSLALPPAKEDLHAPPADACPNWRWVAENAHPGKSCPIPSFSNQTGVLTRDPDSSDHPKSSHRFCVYELQFNLQNEGKKQSAANFQENPLQGLIEEGRLNAADRDCSVVGSLAPDETLAAQTWKPLRKHFDDQVGKATLPEAEQQSVRLTIVDTQPENLWDKQEPGLSPHGWALAHMGRHLVCPDGVPPSGGQCLAKVTTQLALPWSGLNAKQFKEKFLKTQSGGYFGTVFDLAKAIGRELNEVAPDEHVVLNLSVGWEGTDEELEEGKVDSMPLPTQLLYRVLQEAACKGVLVIAAAGNRVGGPNPREGLLLPAAWVGRRVTKETCDGILSAESGEEESAPSPDSDFPRPLIYAVGGVDSMSKPLSNARPGGMPELAAFADHAVVETLEPGVPTKTYTGSSVAAAVASATAAAVWGKHTQLSAKEVMGILYDSGCELPLVADVVADPPLAPLTGGTQVASLEVSALDMGSGSQTDPATPTRTRRVLLSQALNEAERRACEQQKVLECAAVAKVCPNQEPPDLNVSSGHEKVIDLASYTEQLPSANCTAEEILVPGGTQPPTLDPGSQKPTWVPCPADQYEGIQARPWTGPQPGEPPCSNCTVEPQGSGDGFVAGDSDLPPFDSGPYSLYIEIDDDWPKGAVLSNPTLRLGKTLYPLVGPEWASMKSGNGVTLKVVNIPGNLEGPAARIVLEFTVQENTDSTPGQEMRSVENPILVAR